MAVAANRIYAASLEYFSKSPANFVAPEPPSLTIGRRRTIIVLETAYCAPSTPVTNHDSGCESIRFFSGLVEGRLALEIDTVNLNEEFEQLIGMKSKTVGERWW